MSGAPAWRLQREPIRRDGPLLAWPRYTNRRGGWGEGASAQYGLTPSCALVWRIGCRGVGPVVP